MYRTKIKNNLVTVNHTAINCSDFDKSQLSILAAGFALALVWLAVSIILKR